MDDGAFNSTILGSSPSHFLPAPLNDLLKLILAFGALGEWLKMIILGGALEAARRSAGAIWSSIVGSFFLTVYLEHDDRLYDYMLTWLSRQPEWRKARDLQICSKGSGNNYNSYNDTAPVDDLMIEGEVDDANTEKRRVKFHPSFGTSTTLWFQGCRMTVTRNRKELDGGGQINSLTISMLTRSRTVLHNLLLEARKAHHEESTDRVTVFVQDKYDDWRSVQSRPKRPLESVILPDDIKTTLLEDARDFMASEEWYAERGIPWRRGFLLHGAPGSGKTSLINAIAGELRLDIYVITISKKDMDDATLNGLITEMPAKCIALIEDIDAAFTHDVQRQAPSSDKGPSSPSPGVTLSGLLGAIDGVAAQEGRLLFATTNHLERLDPALSRPGRMDRHIEFGLATKWQASELFKAFYPCTPARRGSDDDDGLGQNEKDPLLGKRSHTAQLPRLSPQARDALATRFADAVPNCEFSMAQLQGHLMGYKTRPSAAIDDVPSFIQRERDAAAKRAQLKARSEPPTVTASPATTSTDLPDTSS